MGSNIGFFKQPSTTVTQPTPSTITFINRPDMAMAVYALDYSLSPMSSEKEGALTHLGLDTHSSNLALAQNMTNRLSSLTERCKKIALETPLNYLLDPDVWLINSVSSACGFGLNIARKENNKTLPDKTDNSRNADITVHKQAHQTLYFVPVQQGHYFEFLNQRHSHPTNAELDKRCDAYFQEQSIHAQQETFQIMRAVEKTRSQLLSELSEPEIDTLYQESLRQPIPYGYPSITYDNSLEARATQVALVSVYQNRLESNSKTDYSNGLNF